MRTNRSINLAQVTLATGALFLSCLACDGGDDPAPTPTGSVTGTVTGEGASALAQATVTAMGKTATTAADGKYTLDGVAAGTAIVTIQTGFGYQHSDLAHYRITSS